MIQTPWKLSTLAIAGALLLLTLGAVNPNAAACGPLDDLQFADEATLARLDGWGDRPERIILIVVDTLRRDALSVYGGTTRTPNIDALAARSQVFQNSVSSFYQTSMSMGALLTGLTPSLESGDPAKPVKFSSLTWCGLARFTGPERKICIPKNIPTLGQVMRKQGYWTMGFASNGFLFKPYGADRGFHDWNEIGERMLPFAQMNPQLWKKISKSRSADRVNGAVWNSLFRRKSDKFFLYIHYMDVHDYRNGREGYEAALAGLDNGIGQVMRWLEEAELLEGTAIVLTADHGERLDEEHFVQGKQWHAGNPAFDELLKVPLLVTPRFSEDDSKLMRSDDVFRLLTEMAGANVEPAGPLADDELYVAEPTYQTYRKGRFKSYRRRDDGSHVLIDLESDPGELQDVAATHPDVVATHADRIMELASALAAETAEPAELSEEDKRLLRELGYLE